MKSRPVDPPTICRPGGHSAISLHIIIDGYNLIRRSTSWQMLDAEDIMLGREALLEQLASYKKRRPHRLTVVFDGGSAPAGSPRRQRSSGIEVRFSRMGETADAVIKRMVRKERERALVVSSDRDVSAEAAAFGAGTIGAAEFEQRLLASLYGQDSESEEQINSGWKPTTRKKGPARRRSRRDRLNRKKIRKI